MPTLTPGFQRVPRWRRMILPACKYSPPNFFTPSRFDWLSRPLRELPIPFLCAIAVGILVSLRAALARQPLGWLFEGCSRRRLKRAAADLVHLRRWVDRRQDVIGWCRRPGRRWDRPALWDGPCPR